MIRFTCKCGNGLEAANDEAGLPVTCPACRAEVIVPESREAFRAGAAASGSVASAVEESPRRRPSRDYDDDEALERLPAGSSGKALAALILGVLSFCAPLFLSIPAIILGAMGIGEINRSRGRLSGKGMAIAGIVTASASVLLAPAVMIALLVPAVQKVREAAAMTQSQNNLKQIALAMHLYHDINRTLPQRAIYSKDGRPLLSWRVTILPFIEQNQLFQRFKLDEPWDSPNNRPLAALMPQTYLLPTELPGLGTTHYQVFVGTNTVFPASSQEKVTLPGGIPDGTSNTILVVEAADPVIWTKPEDLAYDPNRPLPRLGGHFRRGGSVAMADGAVFFIDPATISEQTLRNAITRNDGQALGLDFRPR
jgi:hypothetical protein